MTNTDDLIPEIEKQDAKTKTIFRVLLLVLSIFTIVFFKSVVGVIDDFKHLPTLAYFSFAIMVSFPAIGLLLIAFRKKIGWIYNLVFYFFISALMTSGLVKGLVENTNINYLREIEKILVLFLAVACNVLLLTGSVRSYLGIKKVQLIVMLVAAILVSGVLFTVLK